MGRAKHNSISRTARKHISPRCANVFLCCRILIVFLIILIGGEIAEAQRQGLDIAPERRHIEVRDPCHFSPGGFPAGDVPFTVALEDDRLADRLSLDEAIQIAIQNAEVIRVLTGISATSTGQTIYSVAASNTAIDSQLSVFDPTISVTSTINKSDTPFATFNPVDLTSALISGSSTDSINTTVNLQKQSYNGGTVGLNIGATGSFFEPGAALLEPQNQSFAEITLLQPFLQGFGRDANLTPVIVAGINTELSFFQFKSSVQQLVLSVITGYWNLVSARVVVWATEQQIEQAEFAFNRAQARKEADLAVAADVAQTRSTLANFRASLITARSNLILAETALRNVMGLPPSSNRVIVPTSVPVLEQIDFDWNEIVSIAEQHRPEIIELKLILEADTQQLRQANNAALPALNGIANYRWDGLSGETAGGDFVRAEGGRFAGFNLGVSFSVPLGLRASRAALRQSELVLAQDRKNLDQGIHNMVHQLTINYRNLDQFYLQIEAFREARKAARVSYENQASAVSTGEREFINVLTAITDWGNAVSQEAQSITLYNTELANVEAETGSILETHGIRFVEERYGSIAPTLFGVRRPTQSYPQALRIAGATDRYNESETNSDSAFSLEKLDAPRPLSNLDEDDDATASELEAMDDENDDEPAFRIKSLKELLEDVDAEKDSSSKPGPINSFVNRLTPKTDQTLPKRSARGWSLKKIFRR